MVQEIEPFSGFFGRCLTTSEIDLKLQNMLAELRSFDCARFGEIESVSNDTEI